MCFNVKDRIDMQQLDLSRDHNNRDGLGFYPDDTQLETGVTSSIIFFTLCCRMQE
jgi:hypothetical protein